MEWNLFSLSKRRVRIDLIELYKCSLNQNWMGSSKVLWVQLEVFWIFASKILNLYLSTKMLRMVPSYPKQKASSAEEKQEISSTICPVNLTWENGFSRPIFRVHNRSSVRKLTLIFFVMCVSYGKGEDMSPALRIYFFLYSVVFFFQMKIQNKNKNYFITVALYWNQRDTGICSSNCI